MRSKEAEILQIMEQFHVDHDTAVQKLDRMIRWAQSYKKFVDGVHTDEELKKEIVNLWEN